jgi:hypothetical protein
MFVISTNVAVYSITERHTPHEEQIRRFLDVIRRQIKDTYITDKEFDDVLEGLAKCVEHSHIGEEKKTAIVPKKKTEGSDSFLGGLLSGIGNLLPKRSTKNVNESTPTTSSSSVVKPVPVSTPTPGSSSVLTPVAEPPTTVQWITPEDDDAKSAADFLKGVFSEIPLLKLIPADDGKTQADIIATGAVGSITAPSSVFELIEKKLRSGATVNQSINEGMSKAQQIAYITESLTLQKTTPIVHILVSKINDQIEAVTVFHYYKLQKGYSIDDTEFVHLYELKYTASTPRVKQWVTTSLNTLEHRHNRPFVVFLQPIQPLLGDNAMFKAKWDTYYKKGVGMKQRADEITFVQKKLYDLYRLHNWFNILKPSTTQNAYIAKINDDNLTDGKDDDNLTSLLALTKERDIKKIDTMPTIPIHFNKTESQLLQGTAYTDLLFVKLFK